MAKPFEQFAPGYISQCISSVNNQEDADESHTQTSVPSSVPALELWEAESHTMLARLKLGKVTPESRLRVSLGGYSVQTECTKAFRVVYSVQTECSLLRGLSTLHHPWSWSMAFCHSCCVHTSPPLPLLAMSSAVLEPSNHQEQVTAKDRLLNSTPPFPALNSGLDACHSLPPFTSSYCGALKIGQEDSENYLASAAPSANCPHCGHDGELLGDPFQENMSSVRDSGPRKNAYRCSSTSLNSVPQAVMTDMAAEHSIASIHGPWPLQPRTGCWAGALVLPASSRLELGDLSLKAGPFEIDGSWDSDTKANPEDRTVLGGVNELSSGKETDKQECFDSVGTKSCDKGLGGQRGQCQPPGEEHHLFAFNSQLDQKANQIKVTFLIAS
ncbi:hypothetical protein ACRRTK_022201 [Alexandromys fortis]